jgi:uracil-DNA glycosylase
MLNSFFMTFLEDAIANMDPTWLQLLTPEFQKPYFLQLEAFLEQEQQAGVAVYPPPHLVFNGLAKNPIE